MKGLTMILKNLPMEENLLKWIANQGGWDRYREALSQAGRKGSIVHDGSYMQALIHRMIMNPDASQQVDHIDGDRLNNQRSNLRLCTHSGNQRNQGPRRDNQSGCKGVFYDKGRIRAAIYAEGTRH